MLQKSSRSRERRPFLLVMAVVLFMLQGCGTIKRMHPPMATLPGTPGHFRIGRILDVKARKAISFQKLIEDLSSKDVIFLGEVHDNPEHHLIQVQILQAINARCGPTDVAMEAFQRPRQDALDRYLEDKISEETFLQTVDWKRSWGYDYHLYRPLLLWAKGSHSRILAVNAPIDAVRKVARQGLSSLTPDERNAIAEEIDLTHQAHRDYLRQVYDRHRHGELESFDYFYQAQCVWEDTMAENISAFLKEGRSKLVVIAGNGHLVNKYGIPDRTLKRIPVAVATLLPFPIHGKTDIDGEVADYVWLTPEAPHRFRFFHEMKRKPKTPKKEPPSTVNSKP